MPRLVLFASTLFVSAALLFLVQPLVGQMILPRLGGAPAVWNTCLVFFQALLLAGYAYAHGTSRLFGPRRQALGHLIVLLLPFVVLTPLHLFTGLGPEPGDNPVPGLLLMLLTSVGLPFFAVAATAPLLQRWFADTDHPDAKDPYFLYAASNAGSLLALLGYPTLVQPWLGLEQQRWGWTVGYGLLVVLIAACAVLLRRSPRPLPTAAEVGKEPEAPRPVLHWLALAFVPSSLMLGATTTITTDVAAAPLLWVLPLAVYLLSFVLVFARLPAWVGAACRLLLPFLLCLVVFFLVQARLIYAFELHLHVGGVVALHVTTLFVASMVCHGDLARTRPAARHLTAFYLWMSLGGVLGGLFNALVAPLVFTSLAEYPIALALCALLLPKRGQAPFLSLPKRCLSPFLSVLAVAVAVDSFRGYPTLRFALDTIGRGSLLDFDLRWQSALAMCVPPFALCLLILPLRGRIGPALAGVVLAGFLPDLLADSTLYRGRSFFTTLSVSYAYPAIRPEWYGSFGRLPPPDVEGPQVNYVTLIHGTTLHGAQYRTPTFRGEPILYFAKDGPIGRIYDAARAKHARLDVGVLGLGVGTLAAYAQKDDRLTFYEIDPLVKAISFDRATYFSYVKDAQARGAQVDLVLGDGRLCLERERDNGPGRFDLLFLDAFTSDAVPVHLLTREALALYLDRLKPDGVLIFNITNTYVDLEPVLANLAIAGAEPLATLATTDDWNKYPDRISSQWLVLARRPEHFGQLTADDAWQPAQPDPRVGVWSDDYSNLFRALKWGGR